MKKNYIITLLFLFIGYVVNSQTVLFDQPIGGTNGIVSDNFSDGTSSVYSSDDFNLTATSNISIITVYGFQNDSDLDTTMTGLDLFIYADAGGVPSSNPTVSGSGLLEIVNLSPSSPALTIVPDAGGGFNFIIDIALAYGSTFSLDAGTYWLVIAPYVTSTDSDRWNWYQSTDGTLSGAQLIDPGDVFGAGVTDWTTLSSLVGWGSLAFKIEETILSVDEFSLNTISVSPNPTSDFINIDMHNTYSDFNAKIYSILGKLVFEKSNTTRLDIRNLSSGIYILKVSTENGEVSRRIIKE